MTVKAIGPIHAICAPTIGQKIIPIPVIPRTLRATGRIPPAR
jgi:hypothetical protein